MSWLSSALKRSKRKGTGIYSWGKSSALQTVVQSIPLAGDLLSAGLTGLSSSSDKSRRKSRQRGKQSVEFVLKDGTRIKT